MVSRRFFFAAAFAALLAACVPAKAGYYPLAISINGTTDYAPDNQLPECNNSIVGLRLGLARAGHSEMYGLAVAAGLNWDDNASGFQVAVFGENRAEYAPFGLFQFSLFGNTLEKDGGVFQVGVYNESAGSAEGFQVGLVNISNPGGGTFGGLQVGLLNGGANDFSGVQIGFLNDAGTSSSASKFSGLQIGAFNIIECPPANVVAVQVGLLNFTEGKDWSVYCVPGLRVIF